MLNNKITRELIYSAVDMSGLDKYLKKYNVEQAIADSLTKFEHPAQKIASFISDPISDPKYKKINRLAYILNKDKRIYNSIFLFALCLPSKHGNIGGVYCEDNKELQTRLHPEVKSDTTFVGIPFKKVLSLKKRIIIFIKIRNVNISNIENLMHVYDNSVLRTITHEWVHYIQDKKSRGELFYKSYKKDKYIRAGKNNLNLALKRGTISKEVHFFLKKFLNSNNFLDFFRIYCTSIELGALATQHGKTFDLLEHHAANRVIEKYGRVYVLFPKIGKKFFNIFLDALKTVRKPTYNSLPEMRVDYEGMTLEKYRKKCVEKATSMINQSIKNARQTNKEIVY